MRKLNFWRDQEEDMGRGVYLMNAMHFDAFAIHIFL